LCRRRLHHFDVSPVISTNGRNLVLPAGCTTKMARLAKDFSLRSK
jgi:hypothetical protein